MNTKRLFTIALVLALALTLAACGGNSDNSNISSRTQAPTPSPALDAQLTPEPASTPETAPEEAPPQGTNIGDIIQFGEYGWRVLDIQDDKMLIIAETIIGKRAHPLERYEPELEAYNYWVPWELSEMRAYLNGEFYDNAFSSDEQAKILETTITDSESGGFPGGNDTVDKVFLLNRDEANKYFADYEGGDDSGWWLLRGVYFSGGELPPTSGTEQYGVRPAMWIILGDYISYSPSGGNNTSSVEGFFPGIDDSVLPDNIVKIIVGTVKSANYRPGYTALQEFMGIDDYNDSIELEYSGITVDDWYDFKEHYTSGANEVTEDLGEPEEGGTILYCTFDWGEIRAWGNFFDGDADASYIIVHIYF